MAGLIVDGGGWKVVRAWILKSWRRFICRFLAGSDLEFCRDLPPERLR